MSGLKVVAEGSRQDREVTVFDEVSGTVRGGEVR